MEKAHDSQLELFNQEQGLPVEKRSIHSSLVHFIKAYEKVTLVLICMLIVAIAAFSLGVESGKKRSLLMPETLARPQQQANVEPARITPAQPAAPIVVPAALPDSSSRVLAQRPQAPKAQQTPAPAKGSYTIQIASFQNKLFADKEADSLKKNGYTTLVTAQGKYSVVCVGKFNNRKSAEIVLSKLKKQYQGCYIRRL